MFGETYDSVLVLSFGGPEKPEDVIPFLENVLRGKHVPRERMLEVAEHYYHFGGISPINEQNRALVAALTKELREAGPELPVYWGNRNWHPFLPDTLRKMRADGCRRSLAFVTAAFSGYSGCRQYLEDIEKARAEVGEDAPVLHKLRVFYNHPVFVDIAAERLIAAFLQLPGERRDRSALLYTAHSVPVTMAQTSEYERQLRESCRLVSEQTGRDDWKLVYQSRSGPPQQPWLGPDVNDALRELRREGRTDVIVAPIGFLSDHMEVLYDLDTEARATSAQIGLHMIRAATPAEHPRFAGMVRELVAERCGMCPPRAIGRYGPSHDFCAAGCCPAPVRRLGAP